MNHARPRYYRRVRLFCEVPIYVVAGETGVSAGRYAAIETGRREPNPTEQRLIEHFLQDKLRVVFEIDGPVPPWLRDGSSNAIAGGGE